MTITVTYPSPLIEPDLLVTGPQGPTGETGATGATGAAAPVIGDLTEVDPGLGSDLVRVDRSGVDKSLSLGNIHNMPYFYADGNEVPLAFKHGSGNVVLVAGTANTYSCVWKMGEVTARTRLNAQADEHPKRTVSGEPLDIFPGSGTADILELLWVSWPLLTTHDPADRFVQTVGGGVAMSIRLTCTIPIMTTPVPLAVGWRKGQGTYPTHFISTMDDVVAVGSLGNANPAQVTVWSNTNGGTINVEDTGETLAASTLVEFRADLSAAGTVTCYLDGVAVGTPVALDAGDEVFPMIYMVNNPDGGANGGVLLRKIEII